MGKTNTLSPTEKHFHTQGGFSYPAASVIPQMLADLCSAVNEREFFLGGGEYDRWYWNDANGWHESDIGVGFVAGAIRSVWHHILDGHEFASETRGVPLTRWDTPAGLKTFPLDSDFSGMRMDSVGNLITAIRTAIAALFNVGIPNTASYFDPGLGQTFQFTRKFNMRFIEVYFLELPVPDILDLQAALQFAGYGDDWLPILRPQDSAMWQQMQGVFVAMRYCAVYITAGRTNWNDATPWEGSRFSAATHNVGHTAVNDRHIVAADVVDSANIGLDTLGAVGETETAGATGQALRTWRGTAVSSTYVPQPDPMGRPPYIGQIEDGEASSLRSEGRTSEATNHIYGSVKMSVFSFNFVQTGWGYARIDNTIFDEGCIEFTTEYRTANRWHDTGITSYMDYVTGSNPSWPALGESTIESIELGNIDDKVQISEVEPEYYPPDPGAPQMFGYPKWSSDSSYQGAVAVDPIYFTLSLDGAVSFFTSFSLPRPPIADFEAAPLSGTEPLSVSFADLSTTETGSIVSHLWSFGDGDTSSESDPNHTYNEPGTYTVSLQVKNTYGRQATEIKQSYITVEEF